MKKIFLIYIMLFSIGCLKAKKSGFDMSTPSGLIIGSFSFNLANGGTSNSTGTGTATFTSTSTANSSSTSTTTSTSVTTGDVTSPTVGVTNAKQSSLLVSGFIIGTASDNVGVTSVEVSLDSGSFQTATGTTTWKFQIPTASATWKDNSLHTISVRAKDAAGNVSSLTSFSFRKAPNRDVNGDGYADLAAGASEYNTSFRYGRAYVIYGASSGLSISNASSANVKLTEDNTINFLHFGCAVGLGDINGDGYADLVVGAYGGTSNGRVYIYYSKGTSGITATTAMSGVNGPDKIITGSASNGLFGTSLSVGDINGDGYSDLAVGEPGAGASNNGAVYTFHSTGSSGITVTNYSSSSSVVNGSANDKLGQTVAIGDTNGDGFADVIMGATGNNGKVLVYNSSSSGIGSLTFTKTGSASAYQFGSALALGDVNGDGYLDLAVGEKNYISASFTIGRTYIFHSAGSGGLSGSVNTTINGKTGVNGNFGTTVSIGDVNGDGYFDLSAGAPNDGTSGTVYIFHSSGSSGVTASGIGSANTNFIGEPDPGYNFGTAISCFDWNGDNYADLMVGGPGTLAGSDGSVFTMSGSSAGINTTSFPYAFGESSTNSNFGIAVW